ncbi:MAG: DUF2156 domain-containing protein [Acidobacteriota bacterium]|nr:DUF2156 domain-containing protein [Acidobacteriota bacterium]
MSVRQTVTALTPRRAREHRDVVTAILLAHGSEAGQFSVVGPDPWWVLVSPSGEGFVNFVEGARAVVSWRSPVCAASELAVLVEGLLDYGASVRKEVFFIEVSEATSVAGARRAITPLWTGAESYLDLSQWSMSGGRREKIRLARNHAARLGVTWREARPFDVAPDYTGLADVQTRWKRARPERHTASFLRTDFTELGELRRYFVAERDAEVLASVTCSPMNAKGWYLQDLVRDPHAPRGALEGAMCQALDALRDEGYAVASNGPLPFWRPHESWTDQHQLGPFGNRILRHFDRQYRFEGINQFRAKLEPDWTSPLYVLRSRRFVSPLAARSLSRVLNGPPRG